jgi:double-stranded uracil-DNA glycosylase
VTNPKSLSFEPVSRVDARVLILGTLPGAKSLEAGQYYSNPRNSFWRIMNELFGKFPIGPADELYVKRTERLHEVGIAIWDVCHSADRIGSLDVNLKNIKANDFSTFLTNHTSVEMICFNGSKAKNLYDRMVLEAVSINSTEMRYELLPSTSPARAAIPYTEKLLKWRSVLNQIIGSRFVVAS